MGAIFWCFRPVPVILAQARTGLAVDVVYASGVVEFTRQARIAPVVTAPIVAVTADEGAMVARGAALVQLEDGPQKATADQLEAQAALTRAVAARAKRLLDAGFGAPAAHDDAQAQRRAAEAAAASARARLNDYVLKAPFAGRILRRDAEPGDLASAGSVLFIIADPARLRVTVDVDERDVARLAVGQPALIRADGFAGQTFQGTIAQITPAGDATGRVFRIRVALPSTTPLRPGMTIEANLVTGRRDAAVLVPSSAVQDGSVWRIDDGRAHRASVRIGASGGERTEIVSGLPAGSWVAVSPARALREGRRVRGSSR